MTKSEQGILLVYDGACPMCTAFSKTVRIRQAVGNLQLINARESHPILKEIKDKKLNLDEGIVLKYNGILYFGADALNMLALLGTENYWFNRLNAFLFRSKYIAKLLYPFLRSIRNGLLWYNGKSKINNLGKDNE